MGEDVDLKKLAALPPRKAPTPPAEEGKKASTAAPAATAANSAVPTCSNNGPPAVIGGDIEAGYVAMDHAGWYEAGLCHNMFCGNRSGEDNLGLLMKFVIFSSFAVSWY